MMTDNNYLDGLQPIIINRSRGSSCSSSNSFPDAAVSTLSSEPDTVSSISSFESASSSLPPPLAFNYSTYCQKSTSRTLTYKWEIENFSNHGEFNNFLESPPFPSSEDGDAAGSAYHWSLELCPRYQPCKESDEDYLSLYLRMHPAVHGTDLKVKAAFSFAILDAQGDAAYSFDDDDIFIVFPERGILSWGRHCFISIAQLTADAERLLPNDTLTLAVKIRSLSDCFNEYTERDNFSGSSLVQSDFSNLLKSGVYSDVNLIVNGGGISQTGDNCKTFKGHKAILAARIPALNQGRPLNEENMYITDIEPAVFADLLAYVYSGKAAKIRNDELHSMKLLAAAHKYQLEPLKRICEMTLGSSLTSETVIDLLICAQANEADNLKSKCIHYICKNPVDILTTDGWQKLVSEKSPLVAEIFRSIK